MLENCTVVCAEGYVGVASVYEWQTGGNFSGTTPSGVAGAAAAPPAAFATLPPRRFQTVQYERGFGGRPATTLKVTTGPGSLQRPVPPAKPQGFRKPKGFWASHSAPHSGAPEILCTSRPLGRSSPTASVSVGQVACLRR